MILPARNIEIKAKIRDWSRLKQLVIALSDTQEELLEQEDIFFSAKDGRLKLRIFNSSSGELIHYHRADVKEAKQSSYIISKTTDPASLQAALSAALGVIGIVKKKRWLYCIGQTRVHLDEVVNLGEFLELEYVLRPTEELHIANELVSDLMRYLEIHSEDLIACAYIDMLK